MRLYFSDREALREAAAMLGWSCNIQGRREVERWALAAIDEIIGPHKPWRRQRVKRHIAAARAALERTPRRYRSVGEIVELWQAAA